MNGIPAWSNLRLWYKLDETSGTSAADSSGRGFNGTYTNTPGLNVIGRIGNCVDLTPGSSHYVAVPNSIGECNVAAISIAAWLRPDTVATEFQMIYSRFSTASIRIELGTGGTGAGGGNDIDCRICGTNFNQGRYTTGDYLSVGTWTHVAAVYNGGGATNNDKLGIFINGAQVTTTDVGGTIPATTPNIPTSAARVGGRNNNSQYFDGRIDDVMIWDTNLTANQILQLFTRTKPKGFSIVS